MIDTSLDTSATRRTLFSGAPALVKLSRAYSTYIVIMFAVVGVLCMSNQYCFFILMDPIRRDLGVNDTAMGFLAGAAYSVVFAAAGLPLARVADVGNRRNLIAIATAIWSGATMLCGATASFVQLFAARVGVAAAESSFQPAFVSMVGDLFSPARRGVAIAVVMMGGAAGVMVGSTVAGAVAQAYNWRMAFVVVGFPGLLVALLFWLTVPEPVRNAFGHAVKNDAQTLTTLGALKHLISVPTAWRLILASMLLMFAHGAWSAWLPTFFLRVHGLSLLKMSASFGVIIGLSAMTSMLVSGFVSDSLAKVGERWRIRFIAGSLLLGVPFVISAILVKNTWVAWTLIVVYQILTAGAAPVIAAAGVSVIQPRARGLWTSIYNFAGYAVGGVCGPVLVGFLSDRLTHQFGQMGLRYGLLVVPALVLPAALTFYWTSFTADRDAEGATPVVAAPELAN